MIKQPELLKNVINRVMDILKQGRCNMCDYFDDFDDEFMEDWFGEDGCRHWHRWQCRLVARNLSADVRAAKRSS